jgi:hypothetical protein
MNKVYSVKIGDGQGRSFPFHRVYVAAPDTKPLLDRMFRYYIAIPLVSDLRARLLKAISKVTTEKVTHADGKEFGEVMTQNTLKTLLEEPDDLDPTKPKNAYLLVLPIRGYVRPKAKAEQRKEGADTPLPTTAAYMGRSGWTRPLEPEDGRPQLPAPRIKAFDVFREKAGETFLHRPGTDIKPVCLACPMHALHRAGACALGTTTCLEYLPMANMSIYTESLAEAKKLEEASTTTEEGDR